MADEVPVPKSVDRSMRARQLASTVHQGRMIHISILDEDGIDGYLWGWDDETYLLVMPWNDTEIRKILVMKRHVLLIDLYDERSFREHPLFDKMEPLVKPFRDRINYDYFSKKLPT